MFNYDKYEVASKNLLGGEQYLYRFENGFGASVVRHAYSYGTEQGLWELAVVRWRGDDFCITYDTKITNDVVGYLRDKRVTEILKTIEWLPPDHKYEWKDDDWWPDDEYLKED